MNTTNVREKLSKFISLILRHQPQTIGIKLDDHGWCTVEELIEKINLYGKNIDRSILEDIVANDEKQRYSFNEDYTKIRANQGHSINVDLEFSEEIPPEVLYHGTVEKFIDSIKDSGLNKMKRQFVHLTEEIETAEKVGSRRGESIILKVHSVEMSKEGYKFYKSQNNVWLTETVPNKFIEFK